MQNHQCGLGGRRTRLRSSRGLSSSSQSGSDAAVREERASNAKQNWTDMIGSQMTANWIPQQEQDNCTSAKRPVWRLAEGKLHKYGGRGRERAREREREFGGLNRDMGGGWTTQCLCVWEMVWLRNKWFEDYYVQRNLDTAARDTLYWQVIPLFGFLVIGINISYMVNVYCMCLCVRKTISDVIS